MAKNQFNKRKVKLKKIQLQDLKVYYHEEGSGKPLLLLHGWDKSGSVFSQLQKILARNFHTFAPDMPGFGKTSLPDFSWGIKDYAHFVTQFCQAIALEKFCLLGHSFGGRVALEIAVTYPEKVEKLVLTGVPVLRKKTLKRFSFWLVAKMAKVIFLLPPFFLFRRQFTRYLYFFAREKDYYQSQGIMKKVFTRVVSANQEKIIKKIKSPTLIVWGEDDRVTPLLQARYLHKMIKKSLLVVIPGASHKLPYEKPKALSEQINPFLTN
ncbi:MAG TPA: alpha/beta hydrolase [Candidatus Bathyarchaeia archaeon]|nr:alpha/beta hydrolase [Candidatus Bathyarchaeia archaeon]